MKNKNGKSNIHDKYDKEFYLHKCMQNPLMLINTPIEYRTKKICDKAFNIDPTLIAILPNKYRSRDKCDLIIEKYPCMLRYIPEDFLTKLIVENILNIHPMLVCCVPDKFLKEDNYNMLSALVKKEPNTIKYMPYSFITEEICIFIIKNNPELISYLPKKICKNIFENKPNILLYYLKKPVQYVEMTEEYRIREINNYIIGYKYIVGRRGYKYISPNTRKFSDNFL